MDANRRGLGVLVVGVGSIGRQRAAAAVAGRNTYLAAVADIDIEAARRLGRRLGVPAFTDIEDALRHPGVDAVVISTPHADHDDQAHRALDAGKPTLVEKPLSIDADQARALALVADRDQVRLATGFNHRFYPPVRDAMALVGARAIGRVEGLKITIGHLASPEFLAGWHAEAARSGGGTLIDNGPHACDLVRRFVGEVVSAEGYTEDGLGLPPGVESDAYALFQTHEHVGAEVHSSWRLPRGYLTVEVRGDRGHLLVETDPWRLSGRLADDTRVDRRYRLDWLAERVHRRLKGCERSHVRELESFAAGGDAASRPHASGWDGVRATEMVQAVYESAARGRAVRLEPAPIRLPSTRKAGAARGLARR